MRDLKSKSLRVLALCILVMVIAQPLPIQSNIDSKSSNNIIQNNEIQDVNVVKSRKDSVENSRHLDDVPFEISADEISHPPLEGVIDPVQVEQSGYSSTGNISARTDTMVNTEQSLDFDTDHNWVVSDAQLEVTNLEKLYVVNGSFDEGNPGYTINPNGTLLSHPNGWSAISKNGDPVSTQVQRVSYEVSGDRYVTVQNQGEPGPGPSNPQHYYTHYAGTQVFWNQTLEVTPYTEHFLLSFRYLYLQGMLSDSFSGNFSLQVIIANITVYSINLKELSSRGIWFDTGVNQIDIAIPPTDTSFMIGLSIDSTFIANTEDIGSDDETFGITNSQYITVLLDDISLISLTPPDCESVDLRFSINGEDTPVYGTTGTGYAIIENPVNWNTSPLNFSITSNTSVSLDYNAILFNHRYLETTPTTNTFQYGVSYSIAPEQSGSLEMFTYLGFIGEYSDLTIKIYHPSDWQNFSVFDPFLADVTDDCNSLEAYIEIPTSVLQDRLGWWMITCDAFNYAADQSLQRYDSGTSDWLDESNFHSNDKSRLSVSIASMSDIPVLSNPVNFTWIMPNSTIWKESIAISGILGSAVSSSVTFGAMNTTAGIWCISYVWTNETEVAYGHFEFSVHHQATLEVVYEDNLSTSVGLPITVILRFYDIENGLLILNEDASVSGVWAGGTIDFDPNLVKNWWEADFDTSLVGAGEFVVTINSSVSYFETTPVYVTLVLEYQTSLKTPLGPLDALIYGRSYSFDFIYSAIVGASEFGIDDAEVTLSGNGSEWISITYLSDGHYNVTLTPTPIRAQDYNVRFTFHKIGYVNQTDVLSFLIEKIPVEVIMLSSLTQPEHSQVDIEVEVVEADTRLDISDANVTLSVNIGNTGNFWALEQMNETSPGHYIATIIMPFASDTTYTINIHVIKENYELRQLFRDTLVPTFDAEARYLQQVAQYSLPVFFGLIGLVGIVAGQRMYSKKQRTKRMKARAIKSRFDDANNLLGIVVLHKLSGIPIYSKILKGGFEEGMLSAFITAIMHFRSEFDTARSAGDEYRILPISDIIRAIPTQNLVCAFITITSSSPAQEAKMVGYARAIGMTMDDILSQRPTQVVDVKTAKTLEWYFDDFVDGGLIRKYQVAEKKLPKRFRIIEESLEKDIFSLNRLIRNLEASGLSEDDAYLLAMDAIESEVIVPVYPFNGENPPATEEE